jgi:hypothetical protein
MRYTRPAPARFFGYSSFIPLALARAGDLARYFAPHIP